MRFLLLGWNPLWKVNHLQITQIFKPDNQSD